MNTSLCKVCQRVKWGQWQCLPYGQWRHEECGLGSEEWKIYYIGLSKAEQKPLACFFDLAYPQAEGIQSKRGDS